MVERDFIDMIEHATKMQQMHEYSDKMHMRHLI